MHPLDGCRAKVRRAAVHVIELREAIRHFAERSPYRVKGAVDETRNELVFSVEANPEFSDIPLDVVLIAGEIVHQLRSALDHLIWQLVVANTGRPPKGTKSGFPIFLHEAGYNTRARTMIVGVSAEAETRIRAAQPFHAGADANQVLTWVIHELNNTDKHRSIPLTTTLGFLAYVRMRRPNHPPIDIVAPSEHVGDPLLDGMEIARLPVTDDMGDAEFDVPIGADIGFAGLPAVEHQPAIHLLATATEYLGDLIESFRGEFH